MRVFLIAVITVFASFSFADELPGPVMRYYQHRVQLRSEKTPLQAWLNELTPPPQAGSQSSTGTATNCTPANNTSGCVSYACSTGSYNCSFRSDLQELIPLCHGVDSTCAQDVCNQGGLSCTFKSDMKAALVMCNGVSGDCLDAACAQGAFNCSFRSDLQTAAQLCMGVDASCVHDTCALGTYNCTFQSDLREVMTLCKH